MYVNKEKIPLFSFALIFIVGTTITLPNMGGYGLYLPSNNLVWLFSFLFIYVVLLKIIRDKKWQKPGNFLSGLFLLLLLAMPLLWDPIATNAGLFRIGAILAGLVFYVCLFSVFNRDSEKNLLWIIFVAGLIQAIWAFLYFSFAEPPLLTGIFRQPNVMASFLVSTYLVSLVLLRTSYWKTTKPPLASLIVFTVFAFLVGIIIFKLNSRTAYLCLLVSLPLLLLSLIDRSRYMWLSVVCLLIGLIVAAIDSNLLSVEQMGKRLAIGSADVSSGRWAIWEVSWTMLQDFFPFGIGYGNFEVLYHDYRAILYWHSGIEGAATVHHPHNEFMLWLIEGGFVAVVALFAFTIYQLIRIAKKGRSAYPYVVLLLPLAIHAMLEYPFYQSTLHFILFLSLFFLTELNIAERQVTTVNNRIYHGALCHLSFFILSFFFLGNLLAIHKVRGFYNKDGDNRNVSAIEGILNKSAVQRGVDYAIVNDMLAGLRLQPDAELLSEYLSHIDRMLLRSPRPELYIALMEGYKVVQDNESREKIKKIAHYYYPNDNRFHNKTITIENN
ncbi:MAG: hypothetical protein GKR93_16840 [Gammaproteobacteria bacterium]|nr:hypothetical protein [Gammaproteobacteria bacterium]